MKPIYQKICAVLLLLTNIFYCTSRDDLEDLATMMTGSFSSQGQAASQLQFFDFIV